jgi:hypothetical protein
MKTIFLGLALFTISFAALAAVETGCPTVNKDLIQESAKTQVKLLTTDLTTRMNELYAKAGFQQIQNIQLLAASTEKYQFSIEAGSDSINIEVTPGIRTDLRFKTSEFKKTDALGRITQQGHNCSLVLRNPFAVGRNFGIVNKESGQPITNLRVDMDIAVSKTVTK